MWHRVKAISRLACALALPLAIPGGSLFAGPIWNFRVPAHAGSKIVVGPANVQSTIASAAKNQLTAIAISASKSIDSIEPRATDAQQLLPAPPIAFAKAAGTSRQNPRSRATVENARPVSLEVSPHALNFGGVVVGNIGNTEIVQLINRGNEEATVSEITLSGQQFNVEGLSAPAKLSPGQVENLTVTFSPSMSGSAEGTIQVFTNPSAKPITVSLTGNGKDELRSLAAIPPSADFAGATQSATDSQDVTLQNTGNSAITISDVSAAGDSFSVSAPDLPLTLPPSQSATVRVSYSPSNSEPGSGSLIINSDAENSPLTIPLSGSPDAPHSAIQLSWSANLFASPLGYNVYRAATPGGPYNIVNPGMLANPSFVDTSVESGMTYFYVTTAVDDNGHESGYSAETSATAP